MNQQSFDDWSEHLQRVHKAERLATDCLNEKRWDEAWQHLKAMKLSADNAMDWMARHHGKRDGD